jgi:hypothetical protein
MGWSLSDDPKRRLKLMAHEAFHRLQPELNLVSRLRTAVHILAGDSRRWQGASTTEYREYLEEQERSQRREGPAGYVQDFRDATRAPFGEINAHLDTADDRYRIPMEWNALQKAVSVEGVARRRALTDAMTFRAARRALFPDAAEREIPLEIFAGLDEYSGMRLPR